MASFKDSKSRDWDIAFDGPKILAIREECKEPEFFKDNDGEAYGRIASDPVAFCLMTYVLCRKQCRERNVSDDDFYASLGGDAMDAAGEAILQAMLFFSRGRNRELLKVSAAKAEKVQQIAMRMALERLNNPNLEAQIIAVAEKQMDAAIQKALTRQSSALDLPASAESRQMDAPSAS